MATTSDASTSPFDCCERADDAVLLPLDARTRTVGVRQLRYLCRYPHANIWSLRRQGVAMQQPVGGAIEPMGGPWFTGSGGCVDPEMPLVIWAVTQIYPGPAKESFTKDTAAKRLGYFSKALDTVADLVATTGVTIGRLFVPTPGPSVDEPDRYFALLAAFTRAHGIPVVVTTPVEQSSDQAARPTLPARTVAQAEIDFCARWEALASRAPLYYSMPPMPTDKRKMSASDVFERHASEAAAAEPAATATEAASTAMDECKDGTPRVRWTPETWKEAHITRWFTPERIRYMRGLDQGGDEWAESKQRCLTTSSFGTAVAALERGQSTRSASMRRMLISKVWGTRIHPNVFMRWGRDKEDNGKAAFTAAVQRGLLGRLQPMAQSAKLAPFIAMTNAELRSGSVQRDWSVVECMDGRGVNVDVVDKVLAYSYDGLYRVSRPGSEPEFVLIEVKCTANALTRPRVDHMHQMRGMMGGLRKQGIPITRCVYVCWQRHATRFWSLPFCESTYAKLRHQVLFTWHQCLLPLFVARDNGELLPGNIDVPLDIGEISIDVSGL